jgi:Flagellar biosynthesis protein, FliO
MDAAAQGTIIRKLARGLVALIALIHVTCAVAIAEDQAPGRWSGAGPAGQASSDTFSAQSSTLRMLGGLFFCVGIFGFGVHLFKRYGLSRSGATTRRLQVVERVALSPKCSLLLVQLDGREFLLTAGAEQSRLIVPPRAETGQFADDLENACGDLGVLNAQ